MPNYYQLFSKAQPQEGAVILQDVDKAICEFMGMPVHPENWCYDWHNSIGLRLALGWDWDKIRKDFEDQLAKDESGFYAKLLKILGFLEENFTTSSWYQHK